MAPIRSLALLMLAACSTSAVERHTTAASLTRVAVDMTAGGIEVSCADPEPERLRPCMKAVETHDAIRAAWDVWAAAILIAASTDDENALEIMVTMAGPVAELYRELVEALEAFGVELPPLPGVSP